MKFKSRKKVKPIAVRLSLDELRTFLILALKYTDGNISRLVREAVFSQYKKDIAQNPK